MTSAGGPPVRRNLWLETSVNGLPWGYDLALDDVNGLVGIQRHCACIPEQIARRLPRRGWSLL